MNLNVLIVDPDESLLELYRNYLARSGLKVELASSGLVFIEKLHAWKPKVVVLEPELPDGWGDRCVNELTRMPESDRPGLVILTRQDPIRHWLRVFACFVKPMPMASLVDSIHAAAFEADRPIRDYGTAFAVAMRRIVRRAED